MFRIISKLIFHIIYIYKENRSLSKHSEIIFAHDSDVKKEAYRMYFRAETKEVACKAATAKDNDTMKTTRLYKSYNIHTSPCD